MKVLHLNHSDFHGGAARATVRIHECLISSNIDSYIWVNKSLLNDWRISPPPSKIEELLALIRPKLVTPFFKFFKTDNKNLHSPSILNSNWVKRINESDADIVHLHWVQGEMLSISDIGKISKPIVWTLHDMWGFCGAEHLSDNSRWIEGYTSKNKPITDSGIDLNKWTWNRKRRNWKNNIHIVAPSNWLYSCVVKSALMKNFQTSMIPNPLDIKKWKPLNKEISRELIGLPNNKKLLMFGAVGGSASFNKGFDLLLMAINELKNYDLDDLEFVIFGQREPKVKINIEFPIHYMGHLYDDYSLCALYNSVDLVLVPSRFESFCQTASEAQACAVPVIAFDIGGLKDIIIHKQTGYLAKPYDPKDFAFGINFILTNQQINKIQNQSRDNTKSKFSYEIISQKYIDIYRKILNNL